MKRTTIIAVMLAALAIIVGTSAVFHLTQDTYKAFAPGRRHFEAGRYAEAQPLLAQAHTLAPENQDIARYLLWTYDKLDRQEDARRVLENLMQAASQDTAMMLWLADLSTGVRDFERAETLYRRVLTIESSTAVRKKLAEALAWQNKYPEALAELSALADDVPGDSEVLELFADVHLWSGNYDEAIRSYRQLLERPDVDREIYFKLAEALRFAGRNDEAIEMYKTYADQ